MLARDGGMNVPNITQGPGSVTALSRPVAEGDTVAAVRVDSAVRGREAHQSPAADPSFARLAWFDVNGDGHIDPRSAAAGGDATLLVPAHAIDLPTYSRTVGPIGSTHAVKQDDNERATPAANAAQTNRAVDAYQRYGQPPAAAPPAAATPSGPAPAAAAPERAVA
jgi:hypothetical protein